MHFSRRVLIQLAVFAVISLIAGTVMIFGYIKLPAMMGFGRYTVTVNLPQSGGLYASGNVTYRGTQVGKVTAVRLIPDGHVTAELSLNSGIDIPSNLVAAVHSQSAVGEQYVALTPRDATSRPLRNGDVIPLDSTSVPPPIDALLDATDRGLRAIPHDNLKTVIDESFTAVGGLGPELSRIVRGSTVLAIDARTNLDSITTIIDQSGPLLNSQVQSGNDIQTWAAHLADITGQLRDKDSAVAKVIDTGGPAADQARQLFDRIQPTLPVILANLISIGQVAVTYDNDLEQLLVLIPQGVSMVQGDVVANHDSKQAYVGSYLDFNLNINLPAPCTTGFLPATQRRTAANIDAPDRPEGDLYCRIPTDAATNVRGARNIPCETRPGKRAPTVKMCESDQQYVPLNDGSNWKGDPNATLSGQDIPQLAPVSKPPVAITPYDPATGSYIGPDGRTYANADLTPSGAMDKTWQSMLTPPR